MKIERLIGIITTLQQKNKVTASYLAEKLRFGSNITDDYLVEAVYDPALKYRLVEEYGPDSFTELADGMLRTEWGFTTPEAAVGWFLQFGDRVKVLSPPEMVEKMREQAENLCRMYGKMTQT